MHGTLRAVWLAAFVAMIGCGPTLGVRARLAARTRGIHPCTDRHRVLQLTADAFEVAGCGVSVEYTDVAPGRRRSFELMRPAATLARTDLQCDYAGLTTVGTRAPTRRTFAGCGARATYVLGCQPVGGCRWGREGEVTISAPEPTAPVVQTVDLDTPIPPPPGAIPSEPVVPPAVTPPAADADLPSGDASQPPSDVPPAPGSASSAPDLLPPVGTPFSPGVASPGAP